MSDNQFNIKSSTIEKGIEVAKDFIGKLIGPAIEESGLLIADNIKYFRFKNQVKILLRAKKYVELNNLSTKEISLKILVPLLDKASLEEDEELQDKWAKMITNLADSKCTLNNQIFPYILSQISIEEYNSLKDLLLKENEYFEKFKEFSQIRRNEENNLKRSEKYISLKEYINEVQQDGFLILGFSYELSNLERLGLINKTPPKVIVEKFSTKHIPPNFPTKELYIDEQWHEPKTEYESINLPTYRLSELGFSFIEICELKTSG